MPYKLTRIALLATALYAAGACAEAMDYAPADKPMFSFSGFGTLGVVHSSESRADFTNSRFKPDGAGYTHTWSHSVDSRIGAQVTADFTSKLSGILQVISEQNYDGSYRPHVEWANISYAFTPDFNVLVGRIVRPVFLMSDTVKVGYANPWVRPPVEVYSLVPVTNNDGIDMSYRMRFGDITNTTRATLGNVRNISSPGGSKTSALRQRGIFNTTEYGSLTVHMGYGQAEITMEGLHPLFDAFRQFGTQGNAIADKYDCYGSRVQAKSIGASYDPGKWFLLAELAKSKAQCVIGAQTGWYVGGGYRIGKFTPYLTYAKVKVDSNTSDPGLTFDPAGLNPVLNAILGAAPVQHTISIGGRWDFAKSADFKLQYDQSRHGADSPGFLSKTQPDFQSGGKVDLFSATIDFVF